MKSIRATVLLLLGIVPLAVLAQNLEKPVPRPKPPFPYTTVVDPSIPAYHPGRHLSASFKGVESNTVTTLMHSWIDGFARLCLGVKLQVDIGGSGQGGPRLTAG